MNRLTMASIDGYLDEVGWGSKSGLFGCEPLLLLRFLGWKEKTTLPYPIADIEGVEPSHAEKLMHAGIRSTGQLLEACKTPHGRKVTASKTSLAEEDLLRWANIADIARIRGVAKQYLELLSKAGIHSMKELRLAKADNLSQMLRQSNEEKHLCKVTPSVAVVRKWIDQAKALGAKVTSV